MSIVAFILAMLLPLVGAGKTPREQLFTVHLADIPPMPQYAPRVPATRNAVADLLANGPVIDEPEECLCDECCYDEAYLCYVEEFTALFNSYTYKRTKNGRSMINGKFVAMPKGK